MSEYIIRPTSDEKANWTEQPVGAAWSILAEAVTEVDTPDTSDNYVEAPTTSGDINRQATPFDCPPGEYVAMVEGWWYIRTATTGQTVTLDMTWLLSGVSVANVVSAGTAYGWQSTRKEMNPRPDPVRPSSAWAMSAQTTGTATSGTARIAAEFLRVVTRSLFVPHRMPMGP